MPLSEKTYECITCDLTIDRDFNGDINEQKVYE